MYTKEGGQIRNICSLMQAQHIAESAAIVISPERIEQYHALRETSTLSDQRLLAEVLRLANDENFWIFVNAFPNIFKDA